MTGILFVLEVAAFVLVAYWAYSNDKLKSGAGEKGLFAMKSGPVSEEGAPAVPRWKKRAFLPAGRPRWKVPLRDRRRP
jgi:hypothetical protein